MTVWWLYQIQWWVSNSTVNYIWTKNEYYFCQIGITSSADNQTRLTLFFIPRENLVNIEINYSDLNYKITQQQKAVSVSELLGKCYLAAPQLLKRLSIRYFSFAFSLSVEEKNQ